MYSCRLCDNVTGEEFFNTDETGIPICTCGGGKMVIKCPNCHNILPTKKCKTVFIAGLRSSGKTTYLVDVLNSKSSETGLLFTPEAKKTIQFRASGAKNIQAGIQEDATEPGSNDTSSVVTISVIGGGIGSITNITNITNIGQLPLNRQLCLSLTNRAGEETPDLDTLLKSKYINYADYIIFLIDVLNIPGIMQSLKAKNIKTVKGETEFTANLDAAQSVVRAVEQARGKAGKSIPVFVGLSKWDYIERAELAPQGFSIGCYSQDYSSVYQNGRFHRKQFHQNSKVLRNFLLEHDEGNFVNTLEIFFKKLFKSNVYYFAFSNYGKTPSIDENGNVERPVHEQHHAMDPFYFILKDSGIM